MTQIATLETLVTANTAPFTAAMSKAQSSASMASKNIGLSIAAIAAASTAAFFATKKMVDSIDEIGDGAEKLGITVSAYQQLAYAANLGETSIDALSSGMFKLNKNVFAAIGGNEDLAKTFKRLGLDIEALGNADMATQFSVVAEAIKGVQNQNEQAAISLALFGKGGTEYLNLIRKGVFNLRDEFDQLGISVSDLDISHMSELSDMFKRAAEIVKGSLYKAVVSLYGPIKAAQSGFETTLIVVKNLYGMVLDVGKALSDWGVGDIASDLTRHTTEAMKRLAATPGVIGRSLGLALTTGEFTLDPNLVGGVRAGEGREKDFSSVKDSLTAVPSSMPNWQELPSFISSLDMATSGVQEFSDAAKKAATQMGFINSSRDASTKDQAQNTLREILGESLKTKFVKDEGLEARIKTFVDRTDRGLNTSDELSQISTRAKGSAVYETIAKELSTFRQEQMAKTAGQPAKSEVLIKVTTDKGFNFEISKSNEVQAEILRNAKSIMATEAAGIR